MASAKSTRGNSLGSGKTAESGQAGQGGPSDPSSSQRGENKVPYEAENIEHTIRRAMREKEKMRGKNPGHYR